MGVVARRGLGSLVCSIKFDAWVQSGKVEGNSYASNVSWCD